MNAVLDNLDLVLRAFTYTVLLFLVAGVFSLVFGTLLAAFRVGPISVLSKATAVYVTAIRNTPLLIMLIFFRIAGPKIGLNEQPVVLPAPAPAQVADNRRSKPDKHAVATPGFDLK